MTNSQSNEIDVNKFRARIEHEDNLLNQRTGLFLTANGLGAVAVGLNSIYNADLLFIVVVILVNLFWLLCGIQNVLVLKSLTTIYISTTNDSIDDIVRNSTKPIPILLNPTNLLGLFLPAVILMGWLVGILCFDF